MGDRWIEGHELISPMFCQVDDNIPLRVMLLLMDEVFDLKERNQWLRRNIKNLLQQLIRATYGDTINRYHVFLFFVFPLRADLT